MPTRSFKFTATRRRKRVSTETAQVCPGPPGGCGNADRAAEGCAGDSIARSELRRRLCEIAEVDSARSGRCRRYLQAVEDVRKLHANVQTVVFPDLETAAEVGVLQRYVEAVKRANRALTRHELPVGNVGPCGRVQHLGLGRIKAMTLDVEWVGMMNAVEVGPVQGPPS